MDTYRTRLRDVRSFVQAALSAPKTQQPGLLGRAALLLRSTDAIRLTDGSTIAIDDTALAARLPEADDGGLRAALADLDARIAMADGAVASTTRLSAAFVEAQRRAVTRPKAAPAEPDQGLLGLIAQLIDLIRQAWRFVTDHTIGAVDQYDIISTVAGIGLGIAVLVFRILGRGVGERIRKEALAGDQRVGTAEDPAVHLARADAAIAAGHPREALHELYLFALATLTAHETIRFDPALTDRELLGRAAAIPQIGPLRELVAIHERVWFGLKHADREDALRARGLAERIAA